MSHSHLHHAQWAHLVEEFRYSVHIRASETFFNLLRSQGVNIPSVVTENMTFTSQKRIDMKALKQRGIISSYSIVKVRHEEEVVEEG